MGYFAEMSDGNYILYIKVGTVEVGRIFKPAEKPLDEISQTPMPDGFYLYIPDVENGSNDDD